MSHRVALCRTIDAGARIEAIEPFAKRCYASSNSFIKTQLILFNVFTKGGAHTLGGLVTISTFRPSSSSRSSESWYSAPNVMLSPHARRKSISLSGVCSPRANEPNRYASRTS
mgnify:CR=1 FL=1